MTAGPTSAARVWEVAGAEYVPDLSFYKNPPPAAGAASLGLTVGGMCVRLVGLGNGQKASLATRYGAFCSATHGGAETVIHLRRTGRPFFLKPRGGVEPEFYRVELSWESGTLLAASYEWAGLFDEATGSCELTLAGLSQEPRAFDRSIENFLRVVYSHLSVRRGGFLLHSAGLVRGGAAHLFFGPSGSGKTTVSMMTMTSMSSMPSPDALLLSDDLTLVMPHDGGYAACSVPFRGALAPPPVSTRAYPIAGFYRLIQDSADRLDPVSGAKAVAELVGSLPFVTERIEMAGDVIDAAAGAAQRIPVYRLHFRKDNTFWKVIEAVHGARPGPGVDDFPAERGIKP